MKYEIKILKLLNIIAFFVACSVQYYSSRSNKSTVVYKFYSSG